MTDDERLDLFRRLVAVVRGAGLGWVVDEVDALIIQGIEEEVTAAEWTGAGKPKKGETRTTRREFSALEQIDLLLDALRRVVVDGTAVELSIATFFSNAKERSQDTPSIIRFREEPSRDDVDHDGFEVAGLAQLEARTGAIGQLVEYLQIVRVEAAR